MLVICKKKKKKKKKEDMPGIRGPSDYSQEPSRDPCLKINAKASPSFLLFFVSFLIHRSAIDSILGVMW